SVPDQALCDTEEERAHPSILPPDSMAIPGGDRVRCVWVVVPGVVAGGHLPSRTLTKAHGRASPAGHDQTERRAGGARGSDEESGTNGAGPSDDEHRRTRNIGTGRTERSPGASARPVAEVMYPTTSSKSSSSKRLSCQVGSGGSAYAIGVSVMCNATTRSARPKRKTRSGTC